MNDQIMRLAKEAGFLDGDLELFPETIERFAELVRQDYLRELQALKPVAWLHPDKKVDVIVPSSLAWFGKPKPLYALDKVTK
jgi:hypothetical protein